LARRVGSQARLRESLILSTRYIKSLMESKSPVKAGNWHYLR
jgi:hypothetical protein